MAQPLINGIAYTWSQVVIRALNNVFTGVSKITYDDMQEMEHNYGAGNFPVSRGFGKIEASATISLYMEEIEALTAAAPGRRLQNIPEFDITVSYVPTSGVPVTHVIKNCRIKNNKREVSTGDMKIETELELLPSHIEW